MNACSLIEFTFGNDADVRLEQLRNADAPIEVATGNDAVVSLVQ